MRFWFLIMVALVGAGPVNGGLLFQDRHSGPNGEEIVYRFEAKGVSVSSSVDQAKAVKVAKVWADQYYGIGGLAVASAQERTLPFHYWLIAFNAPGQAKSGTYYSIVLTDGSVVEPKVSRQGFAAKADPVNVTKDSELQTPASKVEIHGDIEFDFGWGKGLRYNGPYASGPSWPGPARQVHPAP